MLTATSVSVECSFSRDRILLSHLRNRLRANTVRALMCFGNWCLEGLVDDNELEVIAGQALSMVRNSQDDGLIES